ncbi:hypothetical protein AGLY_016897, partial [Aphis glycines]
ISEIFFFVSLYNITSRKNAPITNFEGGFRLQIEVERMLRLQPLRVVFDCKSNVLDAYNLEFSKSFTKCLCICYLCIVEFSKRFLKFFFFVSLYNITSRKNAPITNLEVERMLRLQTLRVVFDCKPNVLDATNLEFSKRFLKFFFSVSLYNITSRKNAPMTNFEGGFRLQIECP